MMRLDRRLGFRSPSSSKPGENRIPDAVEHKQSKHASDNADLGNRCIVFCGAEESVEVHDNQDR